MISLQPLDIVVIDGLWYMPHHWLIRWRGLDAGVHCLTIADSTGNGWSPEFTGIKRRNISHYKGRQVTIHRLKGDGVIHAALQKAFVNEKSSQGYDFRQWFFGGVLGLTCKKWVEGSNLWTCSEFPYWPLQELCKITAQDEILPMPRLFRYNSLFEKVFDGIWK